MTAENRGRRKMTGREAAEKFGVSRRTIVRVMAEPRENFLARAKARRDRAVELRAAGLKHREIAAEMGVSIGTVGRLLHDAKRIAEQAAAVDVEHPQAS